MHPSVTVSSPCQLEQLECGTTDMWLGLQVFDMADEVSSPSEAAATLWQQTSLGCTRRGTLRVHAQAKLLGMEEFIDAGQGSYLLVAR